MTAGLALLVVGCAMFALLVGVVIPRWWSNRQ